MSNSPTANCSLNTRCSLSADFMVSSRTISSSIRPRTSSRILPAVWVFSNSLRAEKVSSFISEWTRACAWQYRIPGWVNRMCSTDFAPGSAVSMGQFTISSNAERYSLISRIWVSVIPMDCSSLLRISSSSIRRWVTASVSMLSSISVRFSGSRSFRRFEAVSRRS